MEPPILLKRTTSRCPVCRAACPGEVWKTPGLGGRPATVRLVRTCADHGEHSAVISSDARFYWLAQGDPSNACCAGGACASAGGGASGTLGRNAAGRGSGPFETLSTCLALIEIVTSCNLACPTCYAGSPHDARVDAVPLEDLQRRIQGVIDRKGPIEILQLSGGEPTLHPRFHELLAWAHANPGIDYVLLNTNGVRLAGDAAFVKQLGETFRPGRMQAYLQFDGVQAAGQAELRGADLRAMREKAVEACAGIGLPVTLAMTVTRENLGHVWDAVAFGLVHDHVRGVSFQPLFRSGRIPGADPGRVNAADVILGLVEQSGGVLTAADFTPLPCGDPNCAIIGYLMKVAGRVRSVGEFVNFAQVQGFLRDKVRYRLEDLMQCGCENEPLGALLKQFELDERHTFRLFIKPFMDAWSWDQDRIDRCCTHVIRPDGALDSFCRHYSGFPDVAPA